MSIEFQYQQNKTEDLRPGFDGRWLKIIHMPFSERTDYAKSAYNKLKKVLLQSGMKSPLITYQGNILVGMRRFEILKDRQSSFECIELLEDVDRWIEEDRIRLAHFAESMFEDIDEYRSTPA